MNVKDIMQTSVLRVSEESPIKEVARLIFSTGISGAPVVKDEKLVGIITEEDILAHMYPSMKDIIEDYAHVHDFEWMEKNLHPILDTPVKDIMNKEVVSVMSDTPLMKAQSIMLTHKFSKVPVIDNKGRLIGIVSQGDIFRQILKEEIPSMEKERYAGFMSRHYDIMIDWEQRFEQEFPSLFRIFKKSNVKNILDLGVWTGLFSIGLAEEGLKVTGLEQNKFMLKAAEERREKLPKKIKDKLDFKYSSFSDIAQDVTGPYDAAICLGNSLVYLPGELTKTFKGVYNVLREKDGVIILQILNIERVLEKKHKLLNFRTQKTHFAAEQEHLFLEFFDKKGENNLYHNLIVFDSDGTNWIYKGLTSLPIKYIKEEDVQKSLEEAGFTEISVSGYQGDYQGEYVPISFIKPYDHKTSDWMVVIAKRNKE